MDNLDGINPNLIVLLRKLVSNEELAEKFSNCKTLDEFYDFCSRVAGGYTKKELHEFFINFSLLISNGKYDKIILKNSLEKIPGGSKMDDMSKRYIAGIMGLLGVMPGAPLVNSNVNAESSPAYVEKSAQKTPQKSAWKGIATGVIIGSAASAAVAAAIWKYSQNSSQGYLWGFSENLYGGLPNMGNSCYLNAIIQQLYSVKAFHDGVMNNEPGSKAEAALRNIFGKIDASKRDQRMIDGSEIQEDISDLGYDNHQQDAAEFLKAGLYAVLDKYGLIDTFTDPLKIEDAPAGSSIADLLSHGGVANPQARHNYIEREFPSAKNLSEEDQNRLLSVVLREPLTTSHNEGEKSEKEKADKAVERLSDQDKGKIKETNLTPDQILNFNDSVKIQPVGGQFGVILNRTSKNGKSTEVVRVPFVMGKDGVNYRLTGAVAHYGNSMDSGHYYSYKMDSDGRWICYNDNYSSHVNENRMKDDIEHNGIMFVYSA